MEKGNFMLFLENHGNIVKLQPFVYHTIFFAIILSISHFDFTTDIGKRLPASMAWFP
jgi:hypothetical protein